MTAANRFTTVLAVLVLLSGCGGGEPPPRASATPAGATPALTGSTPSTAPGSPQRLVLTGADHGRTITVALTAAVIVRLTTATGASWSDLHATGPAVVVPVQYRTNPGYREWEIRLTGAGTVTLESSCSGTGCERSQFRVSLQV